MYIGIMNNPRLTVEDEIDFIGRAGYDFVDLTIEHPMSMEIDRKKVKQLLKKYNLFVVGHTDPVLPYAYPGKKLRKSCLDELKRCAEIFASLDSEIMNIHPCYHVPLQLKEKLVELNTEALIPISEMVQSFNMTLVLENFIDPFDRVLTFKKIMKDVPCLKFHLDVGHANLGGDGIEKICSFLKKDILHVHLSDNKTSADHHIPLGAGDIDWKSAVNALKKIKYDRTITLEIFTGKSMRSEYLNISKNYLIDLMK